MSVCIPVDGFSLIDHNRQAIHHVIEAQRTELRNGTPARVGASFAGSKALPTLAHTDPAPI